MTKPGKMLVLNPSLHTVVCKKLTILVFNNKLLYFCTSVNATVIVSSSITASQEEESYNKTVTIHCLWFLHYFYYAKCSDCMAVCEGCGWRARVGARGGVLTQG